LNASTAQTPDGPHQIYLSLGSNIQPAENIRRAVDLLREQAEQIAFSACYETRAVGSSASPNFYNMAACLTTHLNADTLKHSLIAPIETRLGRIRTADKNAPRTIDLDIIIIDQQVLDPDLWRRVHLALPLSELIPNLINPASEETLLQVAQRLAQMEPVQQRGEIRSEP
jgi:2-amino-4-hydroxy-6-hydroxymethyldihydropteridine diphosphokinase